MSDMPDWTKPTKQKWSFEFQLVTPNKLGEVIGALDKVDITSVSITEGYYTDTRIQGKLTYYDELDADKRQAYIRIIAKDGASPYTEELGTFIPTSDDVTMEGGIKETTVNLESILYGISMQKLQTPWVCKTGDYAYTNLVNILIDKCNMPVSDDQGWRMSIDKHGKYAPPHDVTFGESALCDAGSSVLELMYGICNATQNRLEVDGHGRVLFYGYTPPANRTDTTFTITLNSEDSIVLDGVTRSSNYLEMASQVTVHAKNDEEKELVSTQNATGRLSIGQRGYVVGKYYDVNQMSPFTQDRANQLANEYLAGATNENVEWTLTTEYMPIYTGDVGYLEGLQDNFGYGTKKKVFVKNRDLDLATMTQKLTLKLASSNDSDTEA